MDRYHVVIGRDEFFKLPEYSCSSPSGAILGKKWRRAKIYGEERKDSKYWLLGIFEEHEKPNMLWERYYPVVFEEETVLPILYG